MQSMSSELSKKIRREFYVPISLIKQRLLQIK